MSSEQARTTRSQLKSANTGAEQANVTEAANTGAEQASITVAANTGAERSEEDQFEEVETNTVMAAERDSSDSEDDCWANVSKVEYKRIMQDLNSFRGTMNSVPKLNRNNFHLWNQVFRTTIQPFTRARRMLDGEIKEGDKKWIDELEGYLVNTLIASIEMEGSAGLSSEILQSADSQVWGFRQLYTHLKERLTKNDGIAKANIHSRIKQIRLFNIDVKKLVDEIDKLWSEASAMGTILGEDLKVQTLMDRAGTSPYYRTTLRILTTTGAAHEYHHISQALVAEQEQLELQPQYRAARYAAPSQDAGLRFQRGRRDPRRPGEQARCYACNEPGHIARYCQNRFRGTSQAAVLSTPASAPAPAPAQDA